MTDSVNWVAFFDPVSLDIFMRRPRALADAALLLFLRYRRLLFRRSGRFRFGSRGTRDARSGRTRLGRFLTGRRRSRSIKPAVILGGTENSLHVVLRLGERNVLDELVLIDARPLRDPAQDPALAGVVAREREMRRAKLTDEIREVGRPHLQVGLGGGQQAVREASRPRKCFRVA